jgi:glycosyltransferase involved in cell wall biosynthesis
VQFAGSLAAERVMYEIGNARALALPSLCFENCPRTLLEAFCSGRPVIVPNRGSLDEMVRHEDTGLKFAAGDENSLSESLSKMLSSLIPIDLWGKRAREEYLARYTPANGFERLMQIYRFARAENCEPLQSSPTHEALSGQSSELSLPS